MVLSVQGAIRSVGSSALLNQRVAHSSIYSTAPSSAIVVLHRLYKGGGARGSQSSPNLLLEKEEYSTPHWEPQVAHPKPHRRPVHRSLVVDLEDPPSPSPTEISHRATSASVNTSSTPYITTSQLRGLASVAQAAVAKRSPAVYPLPTSLPLQDAQRQLAQQQSALRAAFSHARQHHNVRLRKDPKLFQEECRVFRTTHGGRNPSTTEVSPYAAVPLAPIAALKTLAHTDRQASLLYAATQEALLLNQAVMKNELVKSNELQLVRCLRCFHVYSARPRTIWASDVQQSWLEYAKEKEKAQATHQLHRNPHLRKSISSVGRRQRRHQSNPVCCPKCQSPKAQWVMEYIHHRTHGK